VFARVRNLLTSLRSPRRAAAAAAVLALLGLGGYVGGRQLWAWQHYQAAVAALDRYAYAEAKKHLAVCREVWPNGPGTHLLAARAARGEGALQEAVELLRRCRDLGGPPEAVELEHLLVRGQRRDPSALAELRARTAASDPATPEMLEVLVQFYVDTFQLGEALAALDRLLELRPGNVKALLGRGWVHERLFDFAAAAAEYRAAVRLEPGNDKARERLAEMLVITGPPPAALAEYEWLEWRQGPTTAVLLGKARCRRQLGQLEEARELLDQLLAREPGHAEALAERGKVALDLDHLDEAIRWLTRATRADPYSREVHYNLYQCLERAGRAKEAAGHLSRYRALDADLRSLDRLTREVMKKPTDPDLRCAVGELHLRVGTAKDGVHWLHTALEHDQGHRRTHTLLAQHYRSTGQTELAERHARMASLPAVGAAKTREPDPKQPPAPPPP
jgi:predicted Zn-dependent protease